MTVSPFVSFHPKTAKDQTLMIRHQSWPLDSSWILGIADVFSPQIHDPKHPKRSSHFRRACVFWVASVHRGSENGPRDSLLDSNVILWDGFSWHIKLSLPLDRVCLKGHVCISSCICNIVYIYIYTHTHIYIHALYIYICMLE